MTDLAAEYAVCQVRGHTPSDGVAREFVKDARIWVICKFCGTHYRYERAVVERNAPGEKKS